MRFLDGITATRKEELLGQLRAVWTHDSTAIEGNTLSLGDTMFVLQYGLTVKGKPLKDQLDVQNHARAVDRVMSICERGSLREEDVFDLHRLIINEQSFDIDKPVRAYKREDYLKAIWAADGGDLEPFKSLVRKAWQTTLDLVNDARDRQKLKCASATV